MEKFQLKFWPLFISLIVINTIAKLNDSFFWGTNAWYIVEEVAFTISDILLILLIYVIIRNIIRAIKSRVGHQNPETSTYADEKEKELLRKQNEILVHLIQDEHREEDR